LKTYETNKVLLETLAYQRARLVRYPVSGVPPSHLHVAARALDCGSHAKEKHLQPQIQGPDQDLKQQYSKTSWFHGMPVRAPYLLSK
jgi:hypothetical protein